MSVTIVPHPLLDAAVFTTHFPSPLGNLTVQPSVQQLLDLNATAPFETDDSIRKTVRNVFRHGGFKPTGRSKPASEYLSRAVSQHKLGPINVAVDILNAVSLHSGLPISVVDLDGAEPPFRIEIAPTGSSYVFNASGQQIDIGGLVCLFDSIGPCANAVKDSQRTKTSNSTTQTLSVVWGSLELPGRTHAVTQWYRELLKNHEGQTEVMTLHPLDTPSH